MMRDGAIGRNPEITVEGWHTLINALYHAAPEIGWDFFGEIKDIALGYK